MTNQTPTLADSVTARIYAINNMAHPFRVAWNTSGYGFAMFVEVDPTRTVQVTFRTATNLDDFLDGVNDYAVNAVNDDLPLAGCSAAADAYRLGALCAATTSDADRFAAYRADRTVVTGTAPDGMLVKPRRYGSRFGS